MIQTILQIAWGAFLIALGFMAWVYIGGENLAALWEWQTGDFVEFWHDMGLSGFFRTDGAPYLTLLYVVIAIFALLLLRRILTFAAKAVLAFTIAQTALYAMGAEGIWQPNRLLYVASGVAVAWLIAAGFIEKIGVGRGVRTIIYRIRS